MRFRWGLKFKSAHLPVLRPYMSSHSNTPPAGMSMGMGSNQGLPPPYPGFSPSHASQSPMMSSHGPPSVGSAHGLPSSPGFFPPKPSPTGVQNPFQQQQMMNQPSQQMYSEYEEKERIRFQIELEFVQCLANPNYINFLAQRGYFKERCFVNYLKYLHGYWTQPAYVKFLKYPLCLHFLELLQHEEFRKEIVNGQCAKFLDDQAILQWQQYTRKRVRLIESATSQISDNSQPMQNVSIKQEQTDNK